MKRKLSGARCVFTALSRYHAKQVEADADYAAWKADNERVMAATKVVTDASGRVTMQMPTDVRAEPCPTPPRAHERRTA
jgi:hypothetical protein